MPLNFTFLFSGPHISLLKIILLLASVINHISIDFVKLPSVISPRSMNRDEEIKKNMFSALRHSDGGFPPFHLQHLYFRTVQLIYLWFWEHAGVFFHFSYPFWTFWNTRSYSLRGSKILLSIQLLLIAPNLTSSHTAALLQGKKEGDSLRASWPLHAWQW